MRLLVFTWRPIFCARLTRVAWIVSGAKNINILKVYYILAMMLLGNTCVPDPSVFETKFNTRSRLSCFLYCCPLFWVITKVVLTHLYLQVRSRPPVRVQRKQINTQSNMKIYLLLQKCVITQCVFELTTSFSRCELVYGADRAFRWVTEKCVRIKRLARNN